MKITISFILLMLFGAMSSAAELKLGKPYIAGGVCSKADVKIRQVEDKLLVSLDRFGLDLDSGSRAGLARVTCNVRIPVTLPSGYRLKRLDGVVEGSIAKSNGADVSLTVLGSIGTISAGAKFDFPKGTDYGAGHIQEVFLVLPRLDFDGACKRQDILGLDAKWIASRTSQGDFVHSDGEASEPALKSEYRVFLEPCR